MSSKIRKCVRELERGEEIDVLLPEYAKQYMIAQDSLSRIRMMMEYYMFYEMISEGLNPYVESAKETADALHGIVEQYFEKEPAMSEVEKMAQDLLDLRREVIDRMDVLTAYVDRFVVYEYVLNRIQYRFDDMETMPSDGVFAQDLLQFIFGSRDNAVISDNIRFAVGQLPMRMTRSRYFDLIKESLSLYKDADKSSLDGFLYMFRTNAMLYRNEHMKEYFTEFVPVLEEFEQLDYDNMDEATYRIYAEKLRVNASKLNDISDLYMELGSLINEMYMICAAHKYTKNETAMEETDLVIRGINALFCNSDDSSVWDMVEEGNILQTSEDKLSWLGEKLPAVEGKQENYYESTNTAGAVLEELIESRKEDIERLGLTDDFRTLKKMFLLNSNSTFADLNEALDEEKVTEERIENETAALILECKEAFKGKSRMLRRAIMANTLEKMPVFFQSSQEVADYVTNSLEQCSDEAEKYAVKQILSDVIDE